MSQTHSEPAPDIDGTPTCMTCHSTRFRDRDGWAECLGCGDRYVATAAAAAEAEQWATATPAPETGGVEYTEPVSAPAPAAATAAGAKKGGWTAAIALVVIAVVVWALFFRGDSAPDGCTTRPAGDAADLANTLDASDFGKVASVSRDGGTYIAATVPSQDDVTVVWFQTSSGTTYSVGPVTALYSNFPDSAAHTKAGVGTAGYDDAKACVA